MEKEDDSMGVGDACGSLFRNHWRGIISFFVPLFALPLIILQYEDKAIRCLFVLIIMTIYWLTEALPACVTSFVPIVLFPILGIESSNDTCINYFRDALAIFLGCLIIALAMQYCNLHKIIAFKTVSIFGCKPRRLLFVILFATCFFSMFLSASPAVAFMCPIIFAILEELNTQKIIRAYENEEPIEPTDELVPSKIAKGFYLGTAYVATVGASSTIIGSPANLVSQTVYEKKFPNSTETITVPSHFVNSLPILIINFVAIYIIIQLLFMGLFRKSSQEGEEIAAASEQADTVKETIKTKYSELGPYTFHQFQVTLLFLFTCIMLMTRKPQIVFGWSEIIENKVVLGSMPVMLSVVLLFVLPIRYNFLQYCIRSEGYFTQKRIPSLVVWKYINTNVPWGLIFTLGGGYALADGMQRSGLSKKIGEQLAFMETMPQPAAQFLSILITMLITALGANPAMCNVVTTIFNKIAIDMKVHPLYLILPVTMAVNMAFHLPVSTVSNAVVSGYAKIPTRTMMFAGILPSLVALFSIFICGQVWQGVAFPGIDKFPDWASK